MAPEDAVPHWEEFYLGSRRFQFVADGLGMPIDQVNFILGQLAGLVLAWVMRVYLHPSRVSTTTRHWGSFLAGVSISYFCFGRQMLLAVALVLGCYLLMLLLPVTLLHHVTLAASLTFLSAMHIQRQFYEDGMFVIDVTGPLMIMVQKATSLAYSLHDGLSGLKDHDLTPLQREMVLRKKPSVIEYFSYMLNFHSILAGPFFMFADYQDFIEGTNYAKRAMNVASTKTSLDSNRNKSVEEEVVVGKSGHMEGDGVAAHRPSTPESEPDPTRVSLYKAGLAAISAFVTVVILPRFPISYITEPAFFQHSYLYKIFFLVAVTSLTRHVYYTAWLLGDSICNMSGIGYNGKGPDGAHRWDMVSNVDVVGVESALSLRDTLEAWNSGTMKWLRFMVYERATVQKTLFTYMLSSMWHGFYPGYYITFVSGAYFTIAARYVRRSVRPRVVAAGPRAKVAYDVLTCLTTRLCLAIFTFPFILLRFWGSIAVYRDFYFLPHIMGVLVIVVLPKVLPPPARRREATETPTNQEKKAQ
ncbi:lysophospholipid acyltransferase 6-like [Scylla paramamosain]|uniref:lysophospholipid acyltransferase 6-like n=1 Tax=Scylla paramamosain TaxID=85552 RepID=UPI003083C46B